LSDSSAKLSFVRYETADLGSIAVAFAGKPIAELCGIYVLRFEGGQSYVGQAVNVVSRYATHRRRWGDIAAVEFATCERVDLDDLERRTISTEERRGIELRNLTLAGRPGGWGDLETSSDSGESILLPWDRSKRATVAEEPDDSPLGRFWKLVSREDYPQMRGALGRYVYETIPDPVLTTHGMWTITALPSTGRTKSWKRLLTLSCGRVESLYLGEETDEKGRKLLVGVINVDPGFEDRIRHTSLARSRNVRFENGAYRAADVFQVWFAGLRGLDLALKSDPVLEAAYASNVRQMREGSRLFGKHHNVPFAADVLNAARARA